MENRRNSLKTVVALISGMGLLFSPFFKVVQRVYGKAQKIILPSGTDREGLIHKDPSLLDTRNLEITPLKNFRTTGVSNYKVNLDFWRLEVRGRGGCFIYR